MSEDERIPITVRSAQGKRLAEFLMAELQLPPNIRWFTVRVGPDLITVECEYLPMGKR